MEKNFDKKKYDNEYSKEHYKQFKVKLKNEEKEELDKLLDQENITKSQFLRDAIDDFKEELKMKRYLIRSRTQIFSKNGENGNWVSCGDATFGNDTKEIFDNYENALNKYNSIDLKDDVSGRNRYSDYKEMYEFDTRDMSVEDVEDGNYDLDKMKLLKDDYSFIA